MPDFFLLFVASFLYNLAINATSLLPAYLAELGAGQVFIGFFNNINTLLTTLVIVFFGRGFVKLDRIKALRIGFVILAASYLLSFLFARSLALLVVFKVFGSIAYVFGYSMLMNMVYDLVPPARRASMIALFTTAGMLTNPIASLLGEAVLRRWDGPALFIAGLAFAILTAGITFIMRDPPRHPDEGEPSHFFKVLVLPQLRSFLILSFLFGVFFTAWATFLPNYTKVGLGSANLSAFMIPFATVSIVMRFAFGRDLDRRPPFRLLSLSFAAIFVSSLLILLPPAWPLIVLSGAIYGIGHSILFPLLSALFVKAGGEEQKAVYNNVFIVVNLLGAVLLTPLLGVLGDLFGFTILFAALALIAALCVVLSVKGRRDLANAEKASP